MSNALSLPPKLDVDLSGDLNTDLMKRVEQTLAQLDDCTDVDYLTDLHNQARGFTEVLRKNKEQARKMMAAQVRIARRIGEVLSQTVRPGNPQLSKGTTIGGLPKGITRDQSSKCQKLAAMPEEVFEEYLATAKKPSMNGILRNAIRSAGSNEEGETGLYCGPGELELMIQRGVKFRTIYADPPWQYSNQGTRGSTDNHYATMPTTEIAALPVEKLAADVAQLHLWATEPFLEDAFHIMKA